MKALDRLFDKLGYAPRRDGVRRRQWKAAGNSRLRFWMDQLLSPDAELSGDLQTLRGRSRNLARDNAHAASAIRVWVDNVVGKGLTYHPLVTLPDQSLDTATNGVLRAWWRAWGARSVCTVDRRHSWHDVERLAARVEFVDGEFLAIERTGRGVNEFGYALQLIDPDQLDETFTQAASKGRNAIRMGVEVDEWGQPLVYHFWPDHPNDLIYGHRERIKVPAAAVLHYFEPLRPGQTRGVPRLAPAMADLKLIGSYREAALAAAAAGACNALLFEQSEDAELGDDEDLDPAGEIPMELEPAMSRLLPKGVKPHAIDVKYPNGNHDDFVSSELRAVAASWGIAYHTLTADLRGASYSGLRSGEQQQREMFRTEHQRIATHLHSRVLRAALKNSVLYDAVQLPSPDWRRYAAHAFAGRGWGWVDPWKDLKAAELEIALRLNTRSALAMESGRSFEEILQEFEQDLKLGAEWGVELPDPKPTGAKADEATATKESTDDDDA